MGAQNTKAGSGTGHLTTEDCAQLRVIFDRIKLEDQDKSDKLRCSGKAFQKYSESSLDDWLSSKICKKLCEKTGSKDKDPHTVPFQGFLQFISLSLKGDIDEKVGVILELCAEKEHADKRTVTSAEITKYARSIIESYLKCFGSLPAAKSWARSLPVSPEGISALAHHILRDLFYPFGPPKDFLEKEDESVSASREFTPDEVMAAVSKSALFLHLHNSVLSHCFNFDQESYFAKYLVPHCRKVTSLSTSTTSKPTLLDLTRVMFLNSQLPPELQDQWRFLFSTVTHGESFSKLLGLIRDKGATIIIVKGNGGRVFGGFAPQSWTLGPKFYGTHESFLFHLSPKLMTYLPTNYNTNFQYFNLQQKTLPNGLGMGGTLEYFGLWLDAEFGSGKCSPTCTTYSSPQLSAHQEFTIDHLEVWGVGPEPQLQEEGERSILDKDPEAKAVLEIMGRSTTASDGYREKQSNN